MANWKQVEQGNYLRNPQAKEMITVSTVAKSLTAGTYSGCTRAKIQAQDADVRYWVTGADPTSTEGFLLYDKETLELRSLTELGNFKAIRDADTDAALAVQYYNYE